MFSGTLLDTLVRLASIGASGVAIFGIFWAGWLLYKLPEDSSEKRHKTLRHYMNVTLVIAAVSAITGTANAYFNRQAVQVAQEQLADANQTATELATGIQALSDRLQASDSSLFAEEIAQSQEGAADTAVVTTESETQAIKLNRDVNQILDKLSAKAENVLEEDIQRERR